MPSAKRILLVDGNDVLRASLAEQLAATYEIEHAGSMAEARLARPSALAIIDQRLPDGDGADLARELREQRLVPAALLLWDDDSAGSDPAEERLAKPFRLAVLLSRLAALLGPAAPEGEPLRVGPYQFRPGAKLLTEGQRKIRLTEKETNILRFLHEAGATVPRQTLLHEVWGYNPQVTTHTLETHIYRLRRKIEEDAGQAKILVTEEGGYRLA